MTRRRLLVAVAAMGVLCALAIGVLIAVVDRWLEVERLADVAEDGDRYQDVQW